MEIIKDVVVEKMKDVVMEKMKSRTNSDRCETQRKKQKLEQQLQDGLNALLPPITKSKSSWTLRLGLAVALLAFLAVQSFTALQGQEEAAEKNQPAPTTKVADLEEKPTETADNSPDSEAPKENLGKKVTPTENADGERHVLKLIPDQKAFIGASSTVLDLKDVFSKTEIAKDGQSLTLELVGKIKDDVAKVSLEGTILTLDWKTKTGKKREFVVRATNEDGDHVDSKFHVQLWEPDFLTLIFTVIGGLGIFLLGMKNMSEGLQAVAGNGLRRMISLVTNNRFMATGVGVLVTMLVQSSSITTVMVVGFVNSGFMNLSQAIGVVMGANIGTTITGWILVLKIGKYGLPIAGAAAFVYLFSKRDRLRYIAMAVMGLGMVFLGLELMKNGFSMVKDLPEFEIWFHQFQADTYFGVLKCALVGCILTFIVQSSSATLGITIGLASIGVIPFETAAALVLGENIGTTITAWLASFGATTNAKRAAYFHVIFNLVGVAWITLIFIPFYLPFIKYIVGFDPDLTGSDGAVQITKAIATTHTCFNIVNTLLFLPFSGYFATMLQRIIPDRAAKEKPHLTSLDVRMLETPVLGVEQSRIELIRMGEGCNKMMDWLKEVVQQETPDDRVVSKTFHREEVLDTIHDEITAFMSHMLAGNVPYDVIEIGRLQLRMADECESVSDYIVNILKSHLKLTQAGLSVPPEYQEKILKLHDEITNYLQLIFIAYENRQTEVITKAQTRGESITHHMKELREEFLVRMSEVKVDPLVSVAFNAQLNAYRRVRDHAMNFAEAFAGLK